MTTFHTIVLVLAIAAIIFLTGFFVGANNPPKFLLKKWAAKANDLINKA
jgi:uncharacterized protein involved in outer membrane biogenesis